MLILRFDSQHISLENAGGKGLNLARLWQAGFNVPQGFILTTDAYQSFIEQNQLKEIIDKNLSGIDAGQTSHLKQASKYIRSAFAVCVLPDEITLAIVDDYAGLALVPVAVRSSATTEDLPDLSFAGQQDTYLNIIGEKELLPAVIGCWSSLWTARAIGYRNRNLIPHSNAAMAVVVQEMVQSEVSGVLFTANPLSGLRSETVIDATYGLGDALVSGQVEPDHLIIDSLTGKVTESIRGSKLVSTHSKPDGGVETIERKPATQQSLNDQQIEQLVALGQEIQVAMGSPQDIEWAYAEGQLHLLQSRPITAQYPLPELSYDPLIAWISFGSVQGILGPMTPLGRDAIQNVIAGAGRVFRLEIDPGESKVFVSAGKRLWIRMSDFIRNPLGNRVFAHLMRFIEPSVVEILRQLVDDQNLGAGRGRLKLSTLRRLIGFLVPVFLRTIKNGWRPEKARLQFDQQVEHFITSIEAPTASDRFEYLAQTIHLMREHIRGAFEFVLPIFIPLLAPGMASLAFLTKLAGERSDLALEVTRGLPDNVTIQMDLALWEVALRIQADEISQEVFESNEARMLAERYLEKTLPSAADQAIDEFLSNYGMRGVGEIDLGRPRWREDPTPVMQTILSYLQVPPDSAPDKVFQRGETAAGNALEELVDSVRDERAGWLKEKLTRTAAHRMRTLLGARESPKFTVIRLMGIIRIALLNAGSMFTEAGTLEHADDLFFLQLDELDALSQGKILPWKAIVDQRKRDFNREARRRQVPRVLLSDGRAFYTGLGAVTDTEQDLSGSPVSPGVVEGKVRIVLEPHKAQLAPGEILVCPGTDPAWTPLFLAAGGLITEVGGMMTHGSVVAREYGIPAVVGVHEATTRLTNGQWIQLNGSEGKITILN